MPDAPPPPPAPAPTPAAAPTDRRVSVPSVLLMVFLLFVLTNRGPGDALARAGHLHALAQMRAQLGNYSAWLHFGNATDGFALPETHPKAPALVAPFVQANGTLDPTAAAYRANVSGYFHGDAVLHDLLDSDVLHDVNKTRVLERRGTWNWTAADRVALIAVDRTVPLNDTDDEVAIVHGRIELADSRTDDELLFFFEAVHFLANGTLYGLAEPNRIRPDLRDLPSVVPPLWLNTTARVVEAELRARIAKAHALVEAGAYDSASEDTYISGDVPETHCPLSLYAQLFPAPGVPRTLMKLLEAEDASPAGLARALPRAPLRLRGALLSTPCALLLALPGAEGISSPAWYRKVTSYAGFAATLHLLLAALLVRQVSRSRTPAGLGRLSRWPFLLQALVDAVSFAGHVTFSILVEGRAAVSLCAPAFLAGVLCTYEMQFATMIYQYQAPENVVVPPPPAPAPAPAPVQVAQVRDEAANEAAEPLLAAEEGGAPTYPPPAPPPAPPAAPPPAPAQPSLVQIFYTQLRADPHARTYVVMCALILGALQLALAPGVGVAVAGLVHAALWTPALVRGAMRGRSAGLSAEYTMGTTGVRLVYLGYVLGCPHNLLDVAPRPWLALLALGMLLQVAALRVQDSALGPAFFVPPRWRAWRAVPAHDWHPRALAAGGEAGGLGDCAICMDAIGREEGGGGAKAGYALAPCMHLFHTACLERWLAIKNICPQCRRPLPPL